MQGQTQGATKDWPEIGVRAHVPPQEEIEVDIRDYPPDTETVEVIRHLVNFEVVREGTNTPVEGFDPPMKITVCYTQKDLDSVDGDRDKLKLREWDKDTGQWKKLSQVFVDCPIEDERFLGAAEVEIAYKWADPPVAWTKTKP